MWLPLTSCTLAGGWSLPVASSTDATHGPAALTSTRARSARRAPVALSSIAASQQPSRRSADTKRVRAITVAPCACAERRFRITSRASSTQASE